MKQLSIREIRLELPHLDTLLAREGEVVITRHGKPIARVVPVRAESGMPSHANLRALMPRLTTGSEVMLRDERDDR